MLPGARRPMGGYHRHRCNTDAPVPEVDSGSEPAGHLFLYHSWLEGFRQGVLDASLRRPEEDLAMPVKQIVTALPPTCSPLEEPLLAGEYVS